MNFPERDSRLTIVSVASAEVMAARKVYFRECGCLRTFDAAIQRWVCPTRGLVLFSMDLHEEG